MTPTPAEVAREADAVTEMVREAQAAADALLATVTAARACGATIAAKGESRARLEQSSAKVGHALEQLEQMSERLAEFVGPFVMAGATTATTSSAATVSLAESGDVATDLSALAAEVGHMTYHLEPQARRRAGQRTLWAFVTGQAAKSAEAGRRGCTRQHTRAQLRPASPEQRHVLPRRRRSRHVPRLPIAAPRGGEEPAHAWPTVRPEKGSRVARHSEVLT